ncbi:MAG TPA: tetratricopeptide repeat protein [Chthoniobacterales bacterium]|nr:tetratricopeptide repeat protein [Chthoniobacterales bacterium]
MRVGHFRITVAAVLASAAFACSAPPLIAQQAAEGGELAQQFQQGMAAFQSGDFAKAAAELEAVVNRAEFSPPMEPIFYTIGSAYFNVPDYKKATAAFKKYQEKFPQGAHASEAAFAIAQCSLLTKDYNAAVAQFAALEKDPKIRDQALMAQAQALKEGGKADQAAAVLEKVGGGEIKSPQAMRGAMMLAQSYAQKGIADKAVQTITKLHRNIHLVDNIVELNALTVELGDQLYGKKFYADALECYRAAYRPEQIVRMQTERIAGMHQAMENNLAAARADPSKIGQLGSANNELKADIANAQRLLAEFQKLPNVTPAIYIRLARCFFEIDKKWESIVVSQEILDRFPNAAEREPSLFGIIVALSEVNQPEKAMAGCEQYLRDFKDGPNAETVGYLLGAAALQANDPRAAETYFGRMLDAQQKGTYREQMRYLLANAKFMAGKHDEAAAEYKKYLSEYPKGQSVEDVVYRIALTALFSGKYEQAMNELNAYMQKYPQGAFVTDAKYRLAVCKYAASLYDDVIKDCKSWEAEYPKNQQLGEVLSLLADSYAATDREQEAVGVYTRSYKIAATDEVMNYALFAASKILQKRGEWDKVSDLFTGFIEERPDHASVITALYWIGKAKSHLGQPDEAKRITADTIKKYIRDPQREPVEMLLTQLAQLCVRKKRLTDTVAGDAVPGSLETVESPSQLGTPSRATDPGAELDALLGDSDEDPHPTARARILFAKAELGRLRRQPAEEEKNIARIAETVKPEDLSPMLLGRAADHLLATKKLDKAREFYQRLMDEFPKSEYVDFAYNGLGEIAFQKNDHAKALRYFTDATEKIAASSKLKEVTLGRGKTLLVTGNLDEARKVFEQVAGMREWRGEATAFSVFSLGEIEARRGRWAEANAYFQRVYVGYQKFLPWVAKAYMASAESFEKLGKMQEAANTYREMLRLADEKKELAGFSETQQARKKLEAMRQQG